MKYEFMKYKFMKYKNGRNNHQRLIGKLLTGNRGFIRHLKFAISLYLLSWFW